MISLGPKLLPRAVSGSLGQLQLGYVLISVVSGTSGGLGNHARYSSAEWAPPIIALGKLALPLAAHSS